MTPDEAADYVEAAEFPIWKRDEIVTMLRQLAEAEADADRWKATAKHCGWLAEHPATEEYLAAWRRHDVACRETP